jgi:CHAT domain-containing protein/Tfp pilus assembly protein PilF
MPACIKPGLAVATLAAVLLIWSAPLATAQSYRTTINQAFEYLKAAKYPEGLAQAQRAVSIAERGGATQKDLAYALIMLANFYSIQGRYADAEPIYKRALAINEKVSGVKSPELANTLGNLGSFYEQQGRYAEAEALWKRALAINEVAYSASPYMFTSQLQNLGQLFVKQARYPEAERMLKRSVSIWQASYGADTPLASRSLGYLGDLYRVQSRHQEAEPLLKQAIDLWQKNFSIKPDFAEMLNDMARLYQAQGRFAEAEQYYNRALSTHEQLFGSPNRQIAATHQAIAGMLAASGDPKKAMVSSRKAIAMTIAYADSEGRGGARVETTNSAIGLSASYFDDHLSLLASAARAKIEPGDALAKEGFEIAQWTSQSSAAAAVQQMAARSVAGGGTLGELVRKSQDLSIAWKEKERALISVAGNGLSPQTQAQLASLRKQMADIEQSRAGIAARLSAEFPQYVSLANPRPAKVAEIQGLLGPSEAILFLLPGAKEVHGFALTRERFEWRTIPLGEKDLVARITAFRQGLDINQLDRARETPAKAGPSAGLFDLALAQELYAALLAPFEEQIKDRRDLLMVPSGVLTALPFHLLVTDSAGAAKAQPGGDPFAHYRNASWLLKRHAIAVLPAISSLKALRTLTRSGAAPKPIVGFGDPVFGPEQPDSGPKVAVLTRAYTDYWQGAGVDRKALSQSLARLPGTADELRNVALKLGAPLDDIYLRDKATEANVKGLPLTDYRIVYFATHGLVAGDIQGVAEPSLALTLPAAASARDDGLLTASEVAQLRLNADWVVLSACNTIAGDKPGAEALSGLARAFFYAGARALLVSHWAMETDAATRLTTRTFDALQKRPDIGRAGALRQAMLEEMNDTADPRNAYPAFWAPLVLVGVGAAH